MLDRFSLWTSPSSKMNEKLADKKPLELVAQRIDRGNIIYSTADDNIGDGSSGGSKLSWAWSKVTQVGRRVVNWIRK